MKRGKDPQFKAVKRAQRLRGELGVRFGTSGLRDQPGGMARYLPDDDEPVYPLGLCPDCDLGGPAAMALVPGEQCAMCGGFPAGEHDDSSPTAAHGRNTRALLQTAFPDWSREDHEAASKRFKQSRDRLDEAWNTHWTRAYRQQYGRDPEWGDNLVSGVGDDGLPDADKNVLRSLSRASTRAHYLTDAHRVAGRFLRRKGGDE